MLKDWEIQVQSRNSWNLGQCRGKHRGCFDEFTSRHSRPMEFGFRLLNDFQRGYSQFYYYQAVLDISGSFSHNLVHILQLYNHRNDICFAWRLGFQYICLLFLCKNISQQISFFSSRKPCKKQFSLPQNILLLYLLLLRIYREEKEIIARKFRKLFGHFYIFLYSRYI